MIEALSDGIFLYHGSYCEVRRPDLDKCAKYKDFGQGFYLTTDKAQAESFSKLSARKAKENGVIEQEKEYGVVSVFQYYAKSKTKIKILQNADVEWLYCIVGHRKKGLFADAVEQLRVYDIVGGKIANDDTNATILTYMAGGFGEVGTKRADDICISLLLPDRLKDQYCFRTDKSLANLSFIESKKIWI